MPIPYPPEYDTDEEKLQWCLAMQEKLRQRHNNDGAQYRTWLESRVPHQEWLAWLATWFQPRQDKLNTEILRLRQVLAETPIAENPDEL